MTVDDKKMSVRKLCFGNLQDSRVDIESHGVLRYLNITVGKFVFDVNLDERKHKGVDLLTYLTFDPESVNGLDANFEAHLRRIQNIQWLLNDVQRVMPRVLEDLLREKLDESLNWNKKKSRFEGFIHGYEPLQEKGYEMGFNLKDELVERLEYSRFSYYGQYWSAEKLPKDKMTLKEMKKEDIVNPNCGRGSLYGWFTASIVYPSSVIQRISQKRQIGLKNQDHFFVLEEDEPVPI